MSDVPCFVGMDVAKAQLDVAIRPSGERWTVPNDPSGVTTLVEQLQARHPPLIVLAATGGLERLVTSAWATAGLPGVVVHPPQARDLARATGQLAKTDALDARALAHFADVIRPTPRPLLDAQTQELRALLGRRQQLVVMRTADKPEGPWSKPATIVTSAAVPGGIYAPYIHPWSGGQDLYFTLSLWSNYSVMLMRATLG